MRSLAEELGIERRQQQAREAESRTLTSVTTAFTRPRHPREWVVDGQVVSGHEGNGLILPARVLATAGHAIPEYLAISETAYSDGRTYLSFAMNPVWIEANTDWRFIAGRSDNPVWVCPDCGGIGEQHVKISIPDRDGGKAQQVKCPRDTAKGWRR